MLLIPVQNKTAYRISKIYSEFLDNRPLLAYLLEGENGLSSRLCVRRTMRLSIDLDIQDNRVFVNDGEYIICAVGRPFDAEDGDLGTGLVLGRTLDYLLRSEEAVKTLKREVFLGDSNLRFGSAADIQMLRQR